VGAELDALGHSSLSLARLAYANRLSQRAQWEDLVRWVDATRTVADVRHDGTLLGYYLRALGETGDLNRLVGTYRECEPTVARVGRNLLLHCRLFLTAFTGMSSEVEALLQGHFSVFPPDVIAFWRATAWAANGRAVEAEDRFRELCLSAVGQRRPNLERRLLNPPRPADAVLTPDSRRQLAEILEGWNAERRYQAAIARPGARPRVTWALLAANVAVFGLEVFYGGSQDLITLERLGALLIEKESWPEPWRYLAATFLHFGPLHLGMNMLALNLLGPFVEQRLGAWRYLALYLGSGVLSMVGVSVMTHLAEDPPPQILVGASGAIMGLVGATAAILFKLWRRDRNRVAMDRLRATASILAFQFIFDLFTREVSMSAHLGGAVIGFLLGLLMRPPTRESGAPSA
jgi:rhomboid protease GluP